MPEPAARGVALRTGRRCIVVDVETCDFTAGSDDQRTYLVTGIRAVQTTPLFSRTGALLGMISTHWRKPHAPQPSELRMLDVLARQAADLIDRKCAEEALRESDRRKEEFLAMLAHELRNPLAPLRNALQILRLTDGKNEATQPAAVALMERQVGQIVRLVDDVLDVSRISRGTIELRKERLDLALVMKRAAEVALPH